ncbi:MAG TPA: hypothetical protein VKT50_03725 [Candidatus Acidoferrales bacterium]|nr:hypothetical protein [Candidatus Acidoferrales bacterium]
MSGAIWTKSLVLWLAASTAMIGATGAQVPAPKTVPQSIVLPLELVSGRPATLAVLSADGRIAAGVKLVLSNGEVVTTDESGRAHFLGPPDAGVLIARILGTEIRAAADVRPKEDAMKLEIAKVPAVAAIKGQLGIIGHGFQGDADRNRIDLGGQSAFVLAASPKELVILASSPTSPGHAVLSVKVGTLEASTDISLVDVVPDPIQDRVSAGKSGKFVVHIRGTTQPVDLEVQNASPEIAELKHGDHEHLRTSGGANNSATFAIKGTHAGEFSYVVRLEHELGLANVQASEDFLQAAEKLAEGDEKRHIGSALSKLRSRNADVRGARKEFAKIAASNSSSDLQALIRAAGEALNGE